MVNPLTDDLIGFGKSRIHIAPGNTPGKSHIIVPIFVDNGRAIGKSRISRVDSIERFVIDLNQIQCILGNIRISRCNSDDGFANKTHFSSRKHGMVGHLNTRKPLRICSRTGNPTNDVFDIIASDNRLDAGQILSRIGINTIDARMGIRASQNRDMQQIGQLNVIDIMCKALNQSGVFSALNTGANRFANRHGAPPMWSFFSMRTEPHRQCVDTLYSGTNCLLYRVEYRLHWVWDCVLKAGARQ